MDESDIEKQWQAPQAEELESEQNLMNLQSIIKELLQK